MIAQKYAIIFPALHSQLVPDVIMRIAEQMVVDEYRQAARKVLSIIYGINPDMSYDEWCALEIKPAVKLVTMRPTLRVDVYTLFKSLCFHGNNFQCSVCRRRQIGQVRIPYVYNCSIEEERDGEYYTFTIICGKCR